MLKKSLLIVDYLLKHGASACIDEFNDNSYLFHRLISYNNGNDKEKNLIGNNQ